MNWFHSWYWQKISYILHVKSSISNLIVILTISISSKSRKSRNSIGWLIEKRIYENIKEKESAPECSKRSWTNRWGEAGKRKYICYPRHYGARSSFLIEIPSYFQPARVTWTPNSWFDVISLSLSSKCEKWNIFIGRTDLMSR